MVNLGSSKIKVCHLASGDLWAGAEVMIAVMVEALVARPECEVHAIVLNPGRLQNRLSELGIPVRVLPESELGPLKMFEAITAELRNARCTVLHTHRYKENILGALAAWWAGVPVCVRTVHGSPEPFRGLAHIRMKVYLWLDRLIQRYLNDRVVVVANYLKSEMSGWLSEEKLAIIYNGVLDDVPNLERKGDTRDGFTVGWAGRMVPVKSLDVLLHAVARLKATLYSIRVRLAGDGPEAKRLHHLSRTLGLKDVVEFCGFVTDISDFLSTLDVFVLPSMQEGIPIAVLEAMRAGVPVVASAVGGIPEIIVHRKNGILVRPCDVDALASALGEIANDNGIRDRIGAEAKATVSSRFSARRLTAELVSLYADLLISKNYSAPPLISTTR